MNDYLKELIAIGASAAVNCRPCLEYHWSQGKEAGITIKEALEAAEVGLMVNRGAAAKTKGYVSEVLTGESGQEQSAESGGCGCGG